MKNTDWSPWLIRMSQGDKEAFQTIYEQTKDHTYRLIYYLSSSKEDVADIVSEVYIELLKSAHKYKPEQPFSSWFNGLIVRQVRSWKRKNWRLYRIVEKVKLFTDLTVDRRAEIELSSVSNQMELYPILRKLPLKAREIIVLKYYQDYTFEDIAVLLDIPLGTVKSRHFYALKQMRRQFELIDDRKESENYVY